MNANIAIDGPAGAGKSTIAKQLAAKLGLLYVDTGSMYRALAVFFLRRGLSKEDEKGISGAVAEASVGIRYVDGTQRVFLNGEDVTDSLRNEETGNMASSSSAYPAVRERLLGLQRELAEKNAVVMDGRDIGTVILPDAALKIYLTASVEERTRRRVNELLAKGVPADADQIKHDIEERDQRDMNRAVAPLRRAEDAVLVDSSDMSIEEVVDVISALYREKCRK